MPDVTAIEDPPDGPSRIGAGQPRSPLLGRILPAIAPLLTVIVLVLIVLRLAVPSMHGVLEALSALWQGAFGTAYDIGNTLNKTTPLILTGLGVAIAFRARMWNIGGEGQFVVGALAASAIGAFRFSHLPPVLLIPLLLIGGSIAGGVWAALAGLMRTRRNVPEVISTIMMNFVAFELLSYLVHGPMQEAAKAEPASEALPDADMLPIIIHGTTLHAGLWIAIAAVGVVAVYLFLTRAGNDLRVVGANPAAARTAGIDVERTLVNAMVWSGALCGLAGAVELSGVLGTLYESYAPGYGFTAVAVALLGRLHPVGVVLAALFFGALTAGCGSMERMAGVSSDLSYVIQAVTLLVLLGFQRANSSA